MTSTLVDTSDGGVAQHQQRPVVVSRHSDEYNQTEITNCPPEPMAPMAVCESVTAGSVYKPGAAFADQDVRVTVDDETKPGRRMSDVERRSSIKLMIDNGEIDQSADQEEVDEHALRVLKAKYKDAVQMSAEAVAAHQIDNGRKSVRVIDLPQNERIEYYKEVEELIGRPTFMDLLKHPLYEPKLYAYDIMANGLGDTKIDKLEFRYGLTILLIFLGLLLKFDPTADGNPELGFWFRYLVYNLIFMFLTMIFGLLAVVRNWPVGYTRKLCHFAIFLLPVAFTIFWKNYSGANPTWDMVWNTFFTLLCQFRMLKRCRRLNTWFMVSYRAIDREEDRPHTNTYLGIQMVTGFATIIGLSVYLTWHHQNLMNKQSVSDYDADENQKQLDRLMALVFVPLMVNTLGDGLAEPVGKRFGKHKYSTRACIHDGKCLPSTKIYHRTLEGSSCVFFSTVLAVLACGQTFNQTQFLVAMVVMPPLMTLVEAWSPHTMDTPFIMGIGTVAIICILQFVDAGVDSEA